jgi:uncharacterized protein YhaN
MILSFILFGAFAVKVSAALAGVLAGFLCYAVLNRSVRKRQELFEDKTKSFNGMLSTAKEEFDHILQKNQTETLEELHGKQEEFIKNSYALDHGRQQLLELEHRKEETGDNRDVMYDSIMNYVRFYVPAEELSEEVMLSLQQTIRQKRQEEVQKQSETGRLYENCRLKTEKVKWELSTLEGNEALLLKNKERYAELEQKRKEDAVELEAVKLALGTIQALSADIHDSFGRQLNLAVSDIIGEVTDQKYTDIKVDEKLDVKVGWNGDYVMLDRLSAGTMDQIYFALRLAVADLLLGRDQMPLLLDDSFALYDENRVKSALLKINDRNQIILFSCHKREKALLKELGIDYNYVDLSDCD